MRFLQLPVWYLRTTCTLALNPSALYRYANDSCITPCFFWKKLIHRCIVEHIEHVFVLPGLVLTLVSLIIRRIKVGRCDAVRCFLGCSECKFRSICRHLLTSYKNLVKGVTTLMLTSGSPGKCYNASLVVLHCQL